MPKKQVDPLQRRQTYVELTGPDAGGFKPQFIRLWQLLLDFVRRANSAVIAVTAPITGGGDVMGDVPVEIGHAESGATPGSYTSANITVDAFGHVTAAANGSGGGLSPFWDTAPVAPESADFTLVKAGGTTGSLSDVSRGVLLSVTPVTGERDILAEVTPPAANFTMTAMFVPNFQPHRFASLGLYLKDSATGKIHSFSFTTIADGSAPQLSAVRWTTLDNFSGSDDTNLEGGFGPFWLRIVTDASDLIVYTSLDGETFDQAYIKSRTIFLANIDRCGVFFGSNPTAAFSPVTTPQTALVMSFDVVP